MAKSKIMKNSKNVNLLFLGTGIMNIEVESSFPFVALIGRIAKHFFSFKLFLSTQIMLSPSK